MYHDHITPKDRLKIPKRHSNDTKCTCLHTFELRGERECKKHPKTPEAISRVGGNEEIIKELIEDWCKFPPELRHSNDSILRIVLAKALTTKDQEKEEEVMAEREQIKNAFTARNLTSPEFFDRVLAEALPTEDNN